MNQTGPAGVEDQSSTQKLIELALTGDKGAFRELVKQHQGYAFRLALKFLGDEDEAKDTTQESFIRVWLHLWTYRSEFKFTTWLYRIVVNISFDKLRSRRRRLQVMEAWPGEGLPVESPESHLETSIVNRDLARQINTLAGGLPPKQQMVFILRDLEDQSVEEVGEILGMSTSAVKANLSYARKWIRGRMESLDEGGVAG